MKKLILGIAIVLLFVSTVWALQYGEDFYNKNKRTALSGNDNDPLKMFIREVDNQIAQGTGQTYYVDSGVAHEGDGSSWVKAKDTLDEAVDLCTADRGDIIYVAQGHSEAMGAAADEVDIDIAGVTVIGCGSGTLRPLFDYSAGDTTGAFTVGAANVTILNCVFKANILEVNDAIAIQAAGDNCRVAYCDFIVETAGTDEFFDCILLGDGADNCIVEDCLFDMANGAADHGIFLDYDTDGMIIRNNIMRGDYAVACIKGDTTLSTNLFILDNILWNGLTNDLNAQPVIELLTGTGGICKGNFMACDVADVAVAAVGDKMYEFANWYNEDMSFAAAGVDWAASAASPTSVTPCTDD